MAKKLSDNQIVMFEAKVALLLALERSAAANGVTLGEEIAYRLRKSVDQDQSPSHPEVIFRACEVRDSVSQVEQEIAAGARPLKGRFDLTQYVKQKMPVTEGVAGEGI